MSNWPVKMSWARLSAIVACAICGSLTFPASAEDPNKIEAVCFARPTTDGSNYQLVCKGENGWKAGTFARPPAASMPVVNVIAQNQETLELAYAGNSNAQTRLGVMYLTSRDGSSNASEGIRLIQLGADAGNRFAQFNRAIVAHRGVNGSIDLPTAITYYQRSVAQGFAGAQNALGLLYLTGVGVIQNKTTAIRLLKAAASQGFAESYWYLGKIAADRSQPLTYNPDLATDWFRKGLPISPAIISHSICVVQSEAALYKKPANISRFTKGYVWCSLARYYNYSDPPSVAKDKGDPRLPPHPDSEAYYKRADLLLKYHEQQLFTGTSGIFSLLNAKNLERRCLNDGPEICGL